MAAVAHIVVGVDGSVGSENALRWAVAEARLRSATVRAVLAWTAATRPPKVEDRADVPGSDQSRSAHQVLHDTVARVRLGDPQVEVAEVVVNRSPVRALVDEAHGAQMLVVGARGLSRMRRMIVGSVSGGCVHEAPGPVVVVHGHVERRTDTRPVVVGVDGSPRSADALRWAADEAQLRGVTLRIVHAWTGVPPMYAGYYPLLDGAAVEKAARTLLDDTVERILGCRADVDVEANLVYGHPASSLIEAADTAQLLVVGTRGHGGFAELLLGSTSHQCLTHANCPVAVIGHAMAPEEATGALPADVASDTLEPARTG
jgi:nucleotide-binding universal stress UspA family protein